MVDFPQNIILITAERSGTHIVKLLLSKYMRVVVPNISDSIDLKHMESEYNKGKPNLHVFHINLFQQVSDEFVDEFNQMIRNKNIYVIFLDRINKKEQALSAAIKKKIGRKVYSPNQIEIKKVKIEKSDIESLYKKFVQSSYMFSLIPFTIHQKIYYEDILENGLYVNGYFIPKSLNLSDLPLKRNHPKTQSIKNYDQVMKWIEEFSAT